MQIQRNHAMTIRTPARLMSPPQIRQKPYVNATEVGDVIYVAVKGPTGFVASTWISRRQAAQLGRFLAAIPLKGN